MEWTELTLPELVLLAVDCSAYRFVGELNEDCTLTWVKFNMHQ